MKHTLLILSLFALSCNPCKKLVKLAEKNPQCLEAVKEIITVYDTIQGDTIYFETEIKLDTMALRDSLMMMLQNDSGDLTPVIKFVTKRLHIEPYHEKNEDYEAYAWIEKGVLKVRVATFPKYLERRVEVVRYLPVDRKGKRQWWLVIVGVLLFLLAFRLGQKS
jgi:hypothetical protein